ncbi:helix-turn-helix domain-containing protein [Zunongwangia sp. F363]|uniref:Helix-turn-helix domain-containing protein n=1 Tax=Autumnicola tepida TaxID=3075595 RepID=A0ABU3C764_9FLAO|nr:helix-turn-helix domain-containing protein [Zunongwangia sp. F363]MDT0642183.1 helix-turn-helix domain-containing protein [Zunongwangia sp. F363]
MNDDDHRKLGKLREIIFQLALGNFAYRFKVEDQMHEIENVGLLMNLLAEELSEFFVHPGAFGEKNLADPYVFVVDSSFIITGINCRFSDLIQIGESELIGKPLSEVVTKESRIYVEQRLKIHFQDEHTFSPVRLIISFVPKTGNIMECWGYCHFLKGPKGVYFFFRGLPIAERKEEISTTRKDQKRIPFNPGLQYQADILNIRKVHQYILDNLHQTLPPLTLIARKFSLNTFKLKKGFKELYQTTIFKFHLNQRLEMSLHMIRETPMPLKIVAKNYGFKDYTHFSKAFKDRYGKAPSYYKKQRRLD